MTQQEAMQAAIDALENTLGEIGGAEVNPSNYRNNDVETLNTAYVAAYLGIEFALAALRALPPDNWRPIATAPKDGEYMMIYIGELGRNSMTIIARWDDSYSIHGLGGHWKPREGGQIGLEATHWRPLPAPPKEGE